MERAMNEREWNDRNLDADAELLATYWWAMVLG